MTKKIDYNTELKKMLEGNRVSLARLISTVESRKPESVKIIEKIEPKLGNAHILGITGPPGAGKSTLVNSIIKRYRALDKTVSVLAIDPSSQFTGGAVLGDRIRMQDHSEDDGVFIRSIATRGSLGGTTSSAAEILKLLDAVGFDLIIVETVGVGQSELDIIQITDTVIVTLVPEAGDVIQTMKAGIMEIGDIFVVNKSDREGAGNLYNELMNMLTLKKNGNGWQIPVLHTIALEDKGVDDLVSKIEDHKTYLLSTNLIKTKRDKRRVQEIKNSIVENLLQKIEEETGKKYFKDIVLEINQGKISTLQGLNKFLKKFKEIL